MFPWSATGLLMDVVFSIGLEVYEVYPIPLTEGIIYHIIDFNFINIIVKGYVNLSKEKGIYKLIKDKRDI